MFGHCELQGIMEPARFRTMLKTNLPNVRAKASWQRTSAGFSLADANTASRKDARKPALSSCSASHKERQVSLSAASQPYCAQIWQKRAVFSTLVRPSSVWLSAANSL